MNTFIGGAAMRFINSANIPYSSPRGWGSALCSFTLVLALFVLAHPAFATYPGGNGQIAYKGGAEINTPADLGIFVTDFGQLTFPAARTGPDTGEMDDYPAWSPDGLQLAFIHYVNSNTTAYLDVINKDGTGLHQVFSSATLGPRSTLSSPSWSPDGKRIAFGEIRNLDNFAIYTIKTDGTGLTNPVLPDLAPQNPNWSSRGDLVFQCEFRPVIDQVFLDDLCVLSDGTIHHLPIDIPSRGIQQTLFPKWSPDGDKIIFDIAFTTFENVAGVARDEIFTINKDGTGLVQLTTSPPVCPKNFSAASIQYSQPTMSPDGNFIVASGLRLHGHNEPVNNNCVYEPATSHGMWAMNADGGHSALIQPGLGLQGLQSFNWRPIPKDWSFNISDGHSNPLKGLKVELRRPDGSVIDDKPINTVGGSYVFERGLAPGDYVIRATLVDDCRTPGCLPSFDIRYAPEPDEPVWIEYKFTVHATNESGYFEWIFDKTDPDLANSNIASGVPRDYLDDMANIYFRTRQYVDWLKTHLTPDTGATVQFYTFAVSDPADGTPIALDDAYYKAGSTPKIVISAAESDFENRDGAEDPGYDNDAPENVEWHEFTHHLWTTLINNTGCPGDKNHAGYNNPDTCDSLYEGFANFLPTFAAQDITGDLNNSHYNDVWDLSSLTKAWGYRPGPYNTEDLAVAALFWDLVDTDANTLDNQVIGADGLHHPVTYTDNVSISIDQLWSQLTSAHPVTVFDLRASFGINDPTIDLDGLGVNDVAPVDVPFLMHGFFPVDTDQTLTDTHKSYHYDVGYAQHLVPTAARNSMIGATTHHVYNAAGTETVPFNPPRKRDPISPNANIQVTVLDASFVPLSGATVNMTINYPDGREGTVSRQLGSGSGALVHLELPAYFDYLLPDDAPLPACDPDHDLMVQVTLSASMNGADSLENFSFDNCTYLQAMAAASGPGALSYTLTVPVYTLTLSSTGSGSGTLSGGGAIPEGQSTTVSATADPGSTFTGWSGPDAAECATGSVFMNADKDCTATFTRTGYILTVTATDGGSVTGGGIYTPGQTATVSATAVGIAIFNGWGGPDADECATGSVVMNADKSCVAVFTVNRYFLTLTTTGDGTITGEGKYDEGQTATVSATANAGSIFSGWSGPDAVECATGSVLMNAEKSCIAMFDTVHTLTLSTAGNGSGTLTGGGTYIEGQSISVSAVADALTSFDGWSGPDAGECATGTVLMTADKNCTATFTRTGYLLTLTTFGGGTVTGGGTYNPEQTATVSATPDSGVTFVGWSGPDAAECGTGSVLMNADKSCTATFAITYTLTLSSAGTGGGNVHPSPGTYQEGAGEIVLVSAIEDDESIFTGWSGPDAAECATGTVVMNADKSCTATFAIAYRLSLIAEGSGSGTVTGGGDYAAGQVVAVSATANTGSTFAGWSGLNGTECATGSVTMDADKQCRAEFLINTPLSLSVFPSNPTILVDQSLPLQATETLSDGSQRVLDGRTLIPAANVVAGNVPYVVVAGDFNGDGKPDLAVTNNFGNSVSILLGDGAGAFAAAANVAVGLGPFAIVVGDLNGDGKADLAVANADGNSLSILLGDGAGSFAAATNVAVGLSPLAVVAGDFNGDGKLDLAVANYGDNTVSILLGDGAGAFAAATNVVVAFPSAVAVGDFNGDGKLDLAVASAGGNSVSILLGDGGGAFAATANVAVGLNPHAVVVEDFNGDGKPDLATANYFDNTVSILLGDGAGSFAAAANVAVGTRPTAAAAGDLNGDGKPDLAVVNFNDNTVSILLGDGAGAFAAATNVAVGQSPLSVVVRDLNGDGMPDLAVANSSDNTVSLLLNSASVTWTSSDPTVATVDATGRVTGHSAGTTTITACVAPCTSEALTGSTTVTVNPITPSLADLAITALSTTATTTAPGASLSVSNAVTNQGTLAAGSSVVAFVLSPNITYGDGDDIALITTRTLASLAPGVTDTTSTDIVIPPTTPPRTYFICAMADAGNAVEESDETNNTGCTPTPITVTSTYTLTLNTAGTGTGIVNGGGAYTSGQTATVSATANAGSTFDGWSGSNGTECASGTVTMNADKSCTATFTLSGANTLDFSQLLNATKSVNINGGVLIRARLLTWAALADISYKVGFYRAAVDALTGYIDLLQRSSPRNISASDANALTTLATTLRNGVSLLIQ
jgi:FG-GAP-like repeat/CARDB/Divergent InlB B-repeat domain/Bacterial Ig-like domain (group 2)/FG-GAP repeat/WD40-like Beta Propeller Repeat